MKQRLSVVELPVTVRRIADATKKDVTIAKVYNFTLRGWPTGSPSCSTDGTLYLYRSRKDEVSLEDGSLL